MKKHRVVFALSLVAALLWAEASQAQWLRRGRRAYACPVCPPVWCPCPQPLMPQPPPAVERVLVGAKARYRIIDTGERGLFFEPQPPANVFAAAPEDDFAGTDRKAAKTSIASTAMEPPFADVRKLLTTLPPDDTMLALGIPKGSTSGRVDQENRNVSVHGFIYAVKFEDDHDYHVILGLSPDDPATAFLNVEVSGLPQGGVNRAKLKMVRDTFKTFFSQQGDQFSSTYRKFDPPIPVRIEGSLFFDVDHKAGVVGPTGMRPTTAWEIHPVTKIEFEVEP